MSSIQEWLIKKPKDDDRKYSTGKKNVREIDLFKEANESRCCEKDT
jgi:hypothetical protein